MRFIPWLLLLLLVVFCLSFGASGFGLNADSLVLWEIRLPRVFMAVLIGACLASAGVMLQGLLRNALAEPGLLGISAGAAAGAACVVLPARLIWPESELGFLLPIGAALGALTFSSIILALNERLGWHDNTAVVLCGLALNALAMAIVGALLVVADPLATRELLFWNLGSLARATPIALLVMGAVFAAALALWFKLARQLDFMALGDEAAASAGVSTQRVKRLLLISVALVAGVAVAFTGMIGFVGLVVPHILRLWSGPSHSQLLMLALPCGGGFLLAADTVSRTMISPAELPIGVVTALVGAPFFLWLLVAKNGAWRQRGVA